jgi:type VI secretion system secreted protein Hcp
MKQVLSVVVLSVAASLVAAPRAAAQSTSAFMLVPGIPGDSTNDRHKDWIDVSSVTQNFVAGAKNTGACTVNVTKALDRSGPLIWGAAVTGQIFTEIRIDIIRTGGEQQRVYDVTLTNAVVTAITSKPTDLNEQVTLSGSAATLRFYPQNPDGSVGAPVTSSVSCK